MADYIGISKSLAVIGITSKPEINYFYGPWENIDEALDNIPQLARVKGLTVGIIEGSEIVEYWFKNGVDLVLKLTDPTLVYTTDEIQQIINVIDSKLDNKVDKVTGSRLLTDLEANAIANAVTRTTFEERLSKKVDAVPGEGLITDSERASIANAIDSNTLSTELAKKVDKVEGGRLITGAEATKLDSAITPQELEPYSLKDTGVLEEAVEVPKEEKQYIKFFDEVNGIEKKISLQNFILGASNPVYPTARALVGEKNGKNDTFTSEYNYIAGSEKLNVNGSVYYPNSGFFKEGNNIILTGAPIPEAGDFMFLEAIYLD